MCRFDLIISAQGESPRSLGTLLEIHNVSASEYQRTQQYFRSPAWSGMGTCAR